MIMREFVLLLMKRERERERERENPELKTHLILYSLSKREKSRPKRTAATNPQFATGPQKCVVFGPVGEFTHRANAEEDINLYFFSL